MTKKSAFLIFLIIGILYTGVIYSVLPHGIHYYVLQAQGKEYIPIACYGTDVFKGYGTRYRDVIDGRIIAKGIDTYEYKDGPTLFPLLPPLILAPFFIPFEAISPGMVITDFVFPILIFLSFFLLVNALSKNRFFALFFSFWLLVQASLILYFPPSDIVELKVFILRFFPFLVDKVPISPVFSLREAFIPGAPFFILLFYFVYQAVSEKTRKGNSAPSLHGNFIAQHPNKSGIYRGAISAGEVCAPPRQTRLRAPSPAASCGVYTLIVRLRSEKMKMLKGIFILPLARRNKLIAGRFWGRFSLTIVKEASLTVAAGVFYGLLFYVYPYFYTFATIFLGIFFLALLVMGKRREAGMIFIAGTIGLVVAIPFLINQFNLANLPQYHEIMDRVVGYEIGHAFRFSLWMKYLTYATMAALALLLGKKLHTPVKALFLAALALAGIIALNIQVVTGFNVQSDHWFTRVFVIVHNIIWGTLAYDLFLYFRPSIGLWIGQYKKTLKVFFFIAVLYFFVFSVGILYNRVVTEKEKAPACTVSASLMNAYEWLNANTPNDSVVMSPSFTTNSAISVYTHNRIFLARSYQSLAPDEEVINRLLIAYKMFGVPSAYLYEMLQTYDGVFNLVTLKYYSRELDAFYKGGSKYGGYSIPLAERNKILNDYTFLKLSENIPYRLDYIFIGPKEKEMGIHKSFLEKSSEVYNSDGIVIYQWKK